MSNIVNRVLSRFFDPIGHETMYASSGNKHFSLNNVTIRPTKIYKQSRQKLGKFLENKVFQKLRFSKTFLIKSWSTSQIFFKDKKIEMIRSFFNNEKLL